jgi:hypothetical protein
MITKHPRQELTRDGMSAIGFQAISQMQSVLFEPFVPWLIAEWEQPGIEALYETEVAKLRLIFAPAEAPRHGGTPAAGRDT